MHIVTDIGHPAHIHLFKNFISEMRLRGHQVLITAADKDIAQELLKAYGYEYIPVGSTGKSLIRKVISVPILDYNLYHAVKNFKPDLLLGHTSIRCAHIGKVLGATSMIFADTEATIKEHILYAPFADVVVSPSCFERDFGQKHIRYDGYHELAYLHPNRFTPNKAVLKELKVEENEPYFVVRFISWDATHDVGHKGFSLEGKRKLVKLLSQYGQVFISSEGPLPQEFESYRFNIDPTHMHDVLAFANGCITEGATMACEAAVLGTPSVFVSTLALGYIKELENKYELVKTYSQEPEALKNIEELVVCHNTKQKWEARRDKMLSDKIDVTAFMIKLAEQYNWIGEPQGAGV